MSDQFDPNRRPAFNANAASFVPNANAPLFVPGQPFRMPPPQMMPPHQQQFMYQQPPPFNNMRPQQPPTQYHPQQQHFQQQQQHIPAQPPQAQYHHQLPTATAPQQRQEVAPPSQPTPNVPKMPVAALETTSMNGSAATPKSKTEQPAPKMDSPKPKPVSPVVQKKEKKPEKPAPTPKEPSPEPAPAASAPADPQDDWEADVRDEDETEEEETPRPSPPPRTRTDENKKEHVNVVFIGHVDAGKSTIGGQIMYLTGLVDKRTLEKYEKQARDKNRESWALSWALDTNDEERDKGKTVEVGRSFFETEKKHFTILDAPGHKSFVPNMIGGASQADLAVLVISARKGEFETGFERGGQTQEHAMLVKTAGVRHLIVLVNKMDDPTVQWEQERFTEIKDKLTPFLRKVGFNPKTDINYIPCSGLTGAFIKDREAAPPESSWYEGESLIDFLDQLPSISRSREGPLRIVFVDKFSDMGTIAFGKVESGVVTKGQNYLLMPNRVQVNVMQLWSDDMESDEAEPGENIKVKLKGIEEDEIMPGFVLCSLDSPCMVGRIFDVQMHVLECRSLISLGYSAVLHLHAAVEEVKVKTLICLVDPKTGKPDKTAARPRFVKQGQTCILRLECQELFCMERYDDFSVMGRFTLRDEGKTIAIGKIKKVIE